MTRYRLTLAAPSAAIEAADTETRQLRGVALPYGEAGSTSGGVLTVDAGAVRIPANLRGCKLFTDHGRTTPVGYALTAEDDQTSLRMSYQVAATPDGDRALLEAAEGVRDSLSVELDNVIVSDGHVTAADLVAVALVPIPAFRSAVLTASDTPDPDTHLTGEPAMTQTDPEPETEPAPVPADPTPEVTAAAVQTVPVTMTPAAPRRLDPTRERRLFASQVAQAMTGARDAAAVNAALSDITPGNAGTDSFPPAWLGQLWEPQAADRAIVNAIGTQALTSMRMEGWKWGTKPQVAPYAGNKADVPSGPAQIVPASADGYRIAGGWDLDRIYVDFSTGFVEAFLAAATADYRKKSQTYFIDGHGAVTGPPAVPAVDGILADATDLGAQADLTTGLSALAGFLAGNGAAVSFVVMASDVFADYLGLKSVEVPWWLQNQGTVNLNGSTQVAGVTVAVDPGLATGTMAAGDRNAVTLYETGPINVQAINLPNGGIDLGLFGYQAQIVHDSDGLAKCSITAGP